MIFFVSDTHFSHSNIVKYCDRPFENSYYMDKTILSNINEVVGEDDVLYFLGDFCHKNKSALLLRKQINCKNVHMILGNHDFLDKIEKGLYDFIKEGFASVSFVKEIIYCNQKIFLSHFPHRSWPSSHKGSWHLYGHTHSKLDSEDKNSTRKTLDVGVDNCINYGKPFGQPFSFKEIKQIMNEYRPSTHHISSEK